MELHDGFIVSIFNYCDRWCEACAFTSRCGLFADMARVDAAMDPNLKAVADAPPLPEDVPPDPPKWIVDLMAEAEAAVEKMTPEERDALVPAVAPQHVEIEERARAYRRWVSDWMDQHRASTPRPVSDPLEVIAWFASLNPAKIHRALTGLAEDDREYAPDFNGSAKVVLIGIERSEAAWRDLAAAGRVDPAIARQRLEELQWLRQRLDAVFPNARAFVRPGFDEPDAVAAIDRG